MTTRAGLAGILTGLILTIIIHPLFAAWQDAYLQGGLAGSERYVWIAAALAIPLLMAGGLLAGRWSGSGQPGRCAVLGGLAGGLAGTLVFCLWGAAAAGMVRWVSPFAQTANAAISSDTQIETIGLIIRQTQCMFLLLFLVGSGLGAAGGWLTSPRRLRHEDVFNKDEPQMALNASITAVCASIVTAVLAAAIFPRLADLLGGQAGEMLINKAILNLPLVVSLILVLISQVALTLVIPHETRQAEHRSGMNEVKMAAYVGIGTAPLLILLLFIIEIDIFSNPLVIIAMLASTAMSLKSLHALIRLVLLRRASFPLPQEDWKKTEASLFGSIANSRGSRLVVLCIGCGMMMVLPIYVCVLSVLINLSSATASLAVGQSITEGPAKLFLHHALGSIGVMTITIIVLSTMYLFYLNLGRWFSKQNAA